MNFWQPGQLAAVVDGLAGTGWCVLGNVGTSELRAGLRAEMAARELRPAGVGKGVEHQHDTAIRRDRIAWLDAEAGPAQSAYLAGIGELIACLNRELFLGLADAEAHFARYEPGAFYRRHLDRFRGDDARTVSTVFYLNPGWGPEDGGVLEIYDADAPERKALEVLPEDGVFACFLSDRIWHSVAPTSRERLSVAGWLRRPALL